MTGHLPSDDYVGEPDYPAPTTTKWPREGLRDTDEARIVCLAPDVCLTQIGSSVVPIPYQIVDYCGHDRDYTPSVRFTRRKSMVMRSRTTDVHGDAPGTRKGIKSATVENVTEPIGHAPEVRAEGSPVIRHLDRFWMNNRNTQGEALFVRDTSVFDAPLDDDPVPGSLVMVQGMQANPVQLQQSNAGTMGGVGAGTRTGGRTQTAPRAPTQVSRRGRFGELNLRRLILEDLVRSFKMSPAESAAEGRAMRAFLSPAGQAVITDQKLLGGRGSVGFSNMGDLFRSETWDGRYGLVLEPEERFSMANDILTSLAGRAVDVRTATDAEVEEILGGRGVAAPKDYAEAKRNAEALARAGVRIAGESLKNGACLVGPYSLIGLICPGEAHHIVPDMVYRTGSRRGTGANSTEGRSLNAPTLNQGMTVCLTSEMHGSGQTGIHGRLREKFVRLEGTAPVPGTATMRNILAQSNAAIREIRGLPDRCKAIAQAAATAQVGGSTGFAAPGRIKEKPLPSPEAAEVMMQGHY